MEHAATEEGEENPEYLRHRAQNLRMRQNLARRFLPQDKREFEQAMRRLVAAMGGGISRELRTLKSKAETYDRCIATLHETL